LRSAVPEANTDWKVAAFVGALAAAPYLLGGPVWDDTTLIAGRLVPLDMAGVLELWSGPVQVSGPGASYYRPLALSLIALVGRVGFWALHLLALLAHAASAGLIVKLCKDARSPLLGGIIFALHPLGSEVLGWASALPDALAVFLGLLAVSAGGGLRMVALVFAGSLCKETAILIPLCFGLAGLMRPGWWRGWLGAILAVVALRFALDVQSPPMVAAKLSALPVALGWSLSGLVWPWPLSAVRDVRLAPAWSLSLGLFVILGLMLGAKRSRPAWSGIALMVLAPVLALPTVLGGYLLGERYMYPALVGLSLWVAYRMPSPRRRYWPVVFLPMVFLYSIHIQRAVEWRSGSALFNSAARSQPESSLPWHLLGMVQLRDQQPSLAADSFERAIQAGRPYPGERTLRLRALVEAGRVAEALAWAEGGPKDGLSAEHLAWWARAAYEAGDVARAAELITVLRTSGGLDGPPWLRKLEDRIGAPVLPMQEEGKREP
jgi:hypothetical protein